MGVLILTWSWLLLLLLELMAFEEILFCLNPGHPMLILKKVIWCLYVLFMLVENILPQSDAEMLFNYETENLGTELQRLPATLIESVEALSKGNLLGNLVGENLSEAEIQVWKAEIDYHSQNKDAYKQQSYRTVLLNW